jgi:hypothetical protein
MEQSDARLRQARGFAGAALALLLCAANAAAQDAAPLPSPNEAHAFLAETFRRYPMDYVAWYGPRTRDNHHGRAGHYGGRDCGAEVGLEQGGRAFAVDWSTISSVEVSGGNGVYVMGPLMRPAQAGGRQSTTYTNFHLYSPDARVSRSVRNAFELLRRACVQPSRFD